VSVMDGLYYASVTGGIFRSALVVEVISSEVVTTHAYQWLTQSSGSVGAIIVFRFQVPTVEKICGYITLWLASMEVCKGCIILISSHHYITIGAKMSLAATMFNMDY
jgi:hypothetical protein